MNVIMLKIEVKSTRFELSIAWARNGLILILDDVNDAQTKARTGKINVRDLLTGDWFFNRRSRPTLIET